MKGKGTSRICRVCLRTDKNLRDINPALSKFHYDLCLLYTSEIFSSQFCAECEHMLKKVYNFKEKCKKAAKLYHDFIHKLLPNQTSLKNITELYKCMPKSPLGHWIPSNNKMFSYEEGVNTELDEIDNIQISGEIKHRSLKTHCKPKYIAEKTYCKGKTNLYKERRMQAAKRWAENKATPAKTPFKVHKTNTVPNVSLLAKTPSKLIVTNTASYKKLIPKTPDPISVVSNQSETYSTSNMDDDNGYEDSCVIEQDPLDIPVRIEIPNTAKPQPITKECSVVLTPLRIFRQLPVATPSMLKTRSGNTPLATIQEVVSSDKTLSKTLPKYLIMDGDRSILKESKINVSGKLVGNVNAVPNKASLMRTLNTVMQAKNIKNKIKSVYNKARLLKTPNTATIQEKNVRQNNVTTTYLHNAGSQKLNAPSTNMPVKMIKDKSTTFDGTAVQKENTVLKEKPVKIPTHISTTLNTRVQKVNTASKDTPLKTISEDTITKPNADTSVFKIEYPKVNLQDLLSSKPNSEVVMEDDILTDWENVVEIESEELTQPVKVEAEEKTQLIQPNVKIVYDSKSGVIHRKRTVEKSIVKDKMDQPISRKRSPTSNVSLSSNGDVIYKEKTQKSDENKSNISAIDNVKRVKMNQQDSSQASNVKNTGSNNPDTKDNATTTKESEVKDKTVQKETAQQVPVQCETVSGLRLRKIDKELLKYTKERLKAALLIKFATCGELKSEDIVIDKEFVMECLDQRVPENVLRRLWRYVLYDIKGRNVFPTSGRNNSKMLFSPDTLRTFRFIQKRYINEKMYREVFDIQYLTTEKEVLEEFQMRKHYACYINATYRCHICYQVFKFLRLRENHMKYHVVNPGDFACEVCSIRFKSSDSLSDHKDVHKAVFKCKLCPLVTYRWNAMVNHYNQHIGTEYKCIPCGTSYKSMSTYRTHMATRLHGRVVCTTCGRNFNTEIGLRKHRALRHKNAVLPEDGASVQCDECPLAFPSQEVLLTHKKRSHELIIPVRSVPYKIVDCRVCGMKGKSYTWLRYHFRKEHPAEILDLVYADIKSHLCHYCGHGCTSENSLKDHINRHIVKASNRSKDIVCNICQKKLYTQKGLRYHLKTHNCDYKCGLCYKNFPRKDPLVKHLRSVHKLTGKEAQLCAIVIKKEKNTPRVTDVEGVKTKTEWGKDGEENTAQSNEGKEENLAWGNDRKEEDTEEAKTEWGNDGNEEDTAWGNNRTEENTECVNDGEEGNIAWGNDGEENTSWGEDGVEEENTECGNDGEEAVDKIEWVNDGEEENTEWGNDGDASATEEVAEEIETWGTEEEIVEDTVWGTVIQAEDVPVWITEVQNEEEVPAGEEMEQ